jgi:hypothetical protein
VEVKSNLSSGPVRSPGAERNKTDTQVAYGVGFGRSIYGWKHNFIELPIALVSCQNPSWVNGNLRNKLMSIICQGAAPIPFGLLAQQEAHVGLGYCSELTSSFSYTRTHTNMCCPLWFKTPPSSDIKIARLRFLFVLRLRTRIDLHDQADLAPARSVTIGSWFSDCIGASSLARCSRIMRVASHQIEVISTHRKIRHFAVSAFQADRWVLSSVLIPIVHKNQTKISLPCLSKLF